MERGAFSRNTELQALRLDSNQISDIVGLFADLKNLRYLNISDNRRVMNKVSYDFGNKNYKHLIGIFLKFE